MVIHSVVIYPVTVYPVTVYPVTVYPVTVYPVTIILTFHPMQVKPCLYRQQRKLAINPPLAGTPLRGWARYG
jgi:hypothetical protein